jgi:hypothetical protein
MTTINPASLASELRAAAEDMRDIPGGLGYFIDLMESAASELERAGGWVPCSVRLPKRGTRVLWRLHDGRILHAPWTGQPDPPPYVTHWHPEPVFTEDN